MVEDVEDFPTKLEFDPFCQFCVLEKCPVKLLEVGKWQDIPSNGSSIPEQRLYKWKSARIVANDGRVRRRIDTARAPGRNQSSCGAPESCRVEAVKRADEVSTIKATADQQDIAYSTPCTGKDVRLKPRLDLPFATKRPAIQSFVHKPRGVLRERDIPDVAHNQPVAQIEF